MTEGNVFTLSAIVGGGGRGGHIPGPDRGRSTHPRSIWGYPIPGLDGRGTHQRSRWGGTPSQVWMRGYPIQGLDVGLPCSRSRWGYPIQGSNGRVPHPRSRWEVSHPADGGTPIQDQDGGYPPSGLDGIPPLPCQEIDQHSEHLLHGGQYAS